MPTLPLDASSYRLMCFQVGTLQSLPVLPDQDDFTWATGVVVALALQKQYSKARAVQGRRRLRYCRLEATAG